MATTNSRKANARSTQTTMMPADIRGDDEEYKRDVEKIEAVQESRGNYILGQGALDKNDSAFLLEEEEKRMLALKRKAASERQLFAEMVAKSRSAELLGRDSNTCTPGMYPYSREEAAGVGNTKGHSRKRVKDRIALQSCDGGKKNEDVGIDGKPCKPSLDVVKDTKPLRDRRQGGHDVECHHELKGLFCEYGDSEDECEEHDDNTKHKTTLPSALDVV